MNVRRDTANCPKCGEVFKLSDLVNEAAGKTPVADGGKDQAANVASAEQSRDANESPDDPTQSPPPGCAYHEGMTGWMAGARVRSVAAWFVIPFAAAWSGFSLGGIYGGQIESHQFNPAISLFGLPFIVGSVVLWSVALMYLAGKVVVECDGNELKVFTGIGGIGARTSVPLESVRAVDTVRTRSGRSGFSDAIGVEARKDFKFGSLLSYTRQRFLVKVIRYKLGLPAGSLGANSWLPPERG
jgi:hypothetical protein